MSLVEKAVDCWRLPFVRQFFRFVLVGVSNTLLDFLVYFVLTRGTVFFSDYLLFANAVAFSCAVASSFLLNNFWTFKVGAGGWEKRIPKFFVVSTAGLAINSAIVLALVTTGFFDIHAKIVATVVVLVWNFTAQKKWTFK